MPICRSAADNLQKQLPDQLRHSKIPLNRLRPREISPRLLQYTGSPPKSAPAYPKSRSTVSETLKYLLNNANNAKSSQSCFDTSNSPPYFVLSEPNQPLISPHAQILDVPTPALSARPPHCIRHSDNFARPPIAHLEPTHLPPQLLKCTGFWPTHLTPPHLSSPALKAPHLCLPALKIRPFARPMHDLSPYHAPP